MTAVSYCTREDVKAALDTQVTARNNAQVDSAVQAATHTIDSLTHRSFAPWTGTRNVDWPNYQYAWPWRIWLENNEVASVSSLVSGGVTISAADYFLRRADNVDEAPYTHIEVDLSSNSSFNSSDTPQRAIAITGVFIGCPLVEEQIGTLSDTLAADASDSANITWTTARFGVGDILRIDSERVIITEKTMVTSGQTLQTPMTAAANNVTVAVTDGTAFAVDAVLLLDSERMLVVDIAGNNLTVRRQWDGSVLAAHTGSTIYTLTGIQISRAQLGTTLAAHTAPAPIYRHVVPDLVRQLAIAEALNTVLQQRSGYARTVGSGDNQQDASGAGLAGLREQVYTAHGRKVRLAAV